MGIAFEKTLQCQLDDWRRLIWIGCGDSQRVCLF